MPPDELPLLWPELPDVPLDWPEVPRLEPEAPLLLSPDVPLDDGEDVEPTGCPEFV